MPEQTGGAEQHNVTEAAPNELKLGEVMRASYRQGGGVGGYRSGIVREINIVGSEFSECRWTHTPTNVSNIRWGCL